MISKVPVVAAAACLVLLSGVASAGEFSAVLHLKEAGEEATLEFLVKGAAYRFDGEVEGERRVVITDKAAGKTTVLDPIEKTWQVLEDHKAAFADPLQAWEMWKERFEKAEIGTEDIDGRSCRHLRYTHPQQEGVVLEVWHSDELEHFVKQVMEVQGRKREMLLTDVKVGPVEAKHFEIPEGYSRKLTKEEIEAALPCLTEIEETQAPVGRRMSAGGELRVKVTHDRPANVHASNQAKEEAQLTVTAYRDGAPKGSIGVADWKLRFKGDSRNYDYNSATSSKVFQVDELRIAVAKGTVRVTVIQRGPDGDDTYLYGGTSTWGDVDPEKGLVLTLTGDHQAGPASEGVLETWTTDDEKKVERFTIENTKSKTWTFAPGSGIARYSVKLELGKGGLRVRKRS